MHITWEIVKCSEVALHKQTFEFDMKLFFVFFFLICIYCREASFFLLINCHFATVKMKKNIQLRGVDRTNPRLYSKYLRFAAQEHRCQVIFQISSVPSQ